MDALVRGKYVVTDPGMGYKSILEDGALYVLDNKIVDIGKFKDIKNKWPEKDIIGNGNQLLMPGIIDSHSHGRGLSPIQKGVLYDFLENNLLDWAYMQNFGPEITSKMCALKHIKSGCTTLHNNGFGLISDKRYYDEESIETYLNTGIRLAYSLGVRNRDKFILDSENFAKTLPKKLLNEFHNELFLDETKIQKDYFEHFNAIYNKYNNSETKILLSPSWAQGCSEELILEAKEVSESLGQIPIHMHCLQTPIQKEFSIRKYGKTTIEFLENLGVLNENIVLGHTIWVTENDLDILSDYNVSVTTHATCNLSMRNALAPIFKMHEKGINVAMGMDDKTVNDDEDGILELRMLHKLHRIDSFKLDSKTLSSFDVLKMGTVNGARVINFKNEIGALKIGMKADMILVDIEEMTRNVKMSPQLNIVDVLIHRGLGKDVNTVIINGKLIMKGKELLSIDEEKLDYEIKKEMEKGISTEQRRYADKLQEIKPYYQKWYNSWLKDEEKPLYNLYSDKR